jgi:hypothetical protein
MMMLLWVKVPSGTQERHLWPVHRTGELEEPPRTETGSGLFTVRAAARFTAMNPALRLLGVRASSV